jgi:two-component system chemotaxis sensor kinase CheA
VVRTNIEKIGGTIDLASTEGAGTSFTIKIPLTLAIVSALIVESAGDKFAIPQISVVELVRAGGTSEHRIESIGGTPVLRLRDRLLPLVSLAKALCLPSSDTADPETDELFVVVSQVGNQLFGIIVDRVFDTEEIVVKPVSPILRDIQMFSGNTILGDGSVIMILDPNGIAASVGTMDDDHAAADAAAKAATSHGPGGEEAIAMLVFRAGGAEPKAVPLNLVARLEEVDAGAIERSDGRFVLQYRGQLMPLVPFLAGAGPKESGRQPILVFADRDRRMGLLVDEIVDIVDQRLEVQIGGEGPGVLGSAVIAGKATDVIDAGHYLRQAHEEWFQDGGRSAEPAGARKVLLVDDSPFFRNLMSPLLAAAGYRVTTAEDGGAALRALEESGGFDIIVSDIDMPGMTGFELAEACRKSERWRSTPMLALSAKSDPGDIERGRAVGFDDYVVKFDRDTLLSAMSQVLAAGGSR